MAFAAGGSKGVKNDINITPLVDVVLVLLIIFMVITPMLQRGKPVHLPKAQQTGGEDDKSDPLILSITTDKKLWVESDEVPEGEIESRIAAEIVTEPNKRLLLKGDDALTVGDVRKLMAHAKAGGAKSVQLAVEELKSK
jgi:biopolymer transport protein TolR